MGNTIVVVGGGIAGDEAARMARKAAASAPDWKASGSHPEPVFFCTVTGWQVSWPVAFAIASRSNTATGGRPVS